MSTPSYCKRIFARKKKKTKIANFSIRVKKSSFKTTNHGGQRLHFSAARRTARWRWRHPKRRKGIISRSSRCLKFHAAPPARPKKLKKKEVEKRKDVANTDFKCSIKNRHRSTEPNEKAKCQVTKLGIRGRKQEDGLPLASPSSSFLKRVSSLARSPFSVFFFFVHFLGWDESIWVLHAVSKTTSYREAFPPRVNMTSGTRSGTRGSESSSDCFLTFSAD